MRAGELKFVAASPNQNITLYLGLRNQQMNVGDLHHVWEVRSLKRKPAEADARKILEKIANQVQPIMRKRKWRVKLLSEFCPTNPRLLGLNVGGGVHVKLRLRRPNSDFDFYPFDQVLDTMLHELCHNAHGPHNAAFYKLWDELRKECEELMSKCITGSGEGFDLPGKRLGGFTRQPPLSSLRQTALAAAEKRSRLGSLLPSGPKRLGGDTSIMVALTPIQAAAMAAERRLQDDIWCGSQSCENSEDGESHQNHGAQCAETSVTYNGSNVEVLNATSHKRNRDTYRSTSFESFNSPAESSFVDASKGVSVVGSVNKRDVKSCKTICQSVEGSDSQSPSCRPECSLVDLTGCSTLSSETRNGEVPDMWECGACTLLNPPLAPVCMVCCADKPKGATKYSIWSCKFCTLENNVKLDKCSACGQWRYSRGAPVSTPSPNIGT